MNKAIGPLTTIALSGVLVAVVVAVVLQAYFATNPDRPIQLAFTTATPVPSLNEPPAFNTAYTSRRICADAATNRGAYLDGNETVGSVVIATDPESDPVSYALGLDDPGYHYLWFEVDSSGQLSVSPAGAADLSGLDASQIYPIVVTAEDGNGGQAALVVGVWLDLATTAALGDGICP